MNDQPKPRSTLQVISVFLVIGFIAYAALRLIKILFMPDTSWLIFLIPVLVVLLLPATIILIHFVIFLVQKRKKEKSHSV